jgi:ribosome-associated protein
METFKIKGDHIQLNQLIKAMGWVANGAESNSVIENRLVKVNGDIELRKRNKIVKGFKVEFNGQQVEIE